MKNNSKFVSKIKGSLTTVIRQVGLVILSLIIASLFIALTGYDPLAVYRGMINGVTSDIGGTIRWTIPLIFTGLSVALAFRTSIWNLGVDGQLYMGAITATAIGLFLSDLSGVLLLPLVIFGGMLAGAFWALISGVLKTQWGASEFVTTLLLNYVAFHITDYLVRDILQGGDVFGPAESSQILPESIWLPRIIQGSAANVGLFIGIALAFILFVLVTLTTLGYEFKVVGTNRLFSHYGGLKVKSVFLKCIALSGAIGGLAGVVEVLAVHHRFPIRFSQGVGFDGIVVAILAKNNPIGVIFSAFFFGALRNGSYNIERLTEVPRSMVLVVQAVVVLIASMQFILERRKKRALQQDETNTKNHEIAEGSET